MIKQNVQIRLTTLLKFFFASVLISSFVITQSALSLDPPTSLGILDVSRGIAGNLPGAVITSANKLVFASDRDSAIGNELYITDLTTNVTTLIKDILAGSGSSNPNNFRPLGNNAVVFSAYSADGNELWATDGTAVGTIQITDISLGASSSFPASVKTVTVSGTSYAVFLASSDTLGTELFVYNATSGVTTAVDVAVGVGSSYPQEIYVDSDSGVILFSAETVANGREPYKTTLAAPATFSIIGDINPGAGSSNPKNFSYIATFFESYYSADNGTTGREPYRNGAILSNINAGAGNSDPNCFTRIGNDMYFIAYDSAYKLFKYNGIFSTITTFPGYTASGVCSQINLGVAPDTNKMLFSSNTFAEGLELWISDGTNLGTVLLKDIKAGGVSSDLKFLATVGSGASQKVLISADDGINGRELWATDGTPLGTTLVGNSNPGPYGSQPQLFGSGANTAVLLSITSYTTAPYLSLIKSDGTSGGTAFINQFSERNSTISNANDSEYITTISDNAIFRMNHTGYGNELFVTNGTTSGTKILKDIYEGERSGVDISQGGYRINDKLVFNGNTAANSVEPWVTDGTTAGTMLLSDIYPGTVASSPFYIGTLNGFLYFTATTTDGTQLFKTDGTPAGTVRAFTAGSGVIGYYGGTIIGSQIIFSCDLADTGIYELCKSDGTLAGTTLIKDIYPGGSSSSFPQTFVSLGNRAVFLADDGVNGYEFWGTDGTTVGTVLLSDALAGAVSQNIFRSVSKVNNGIYFFNQMSDAHGDEIWRTDGTAAGTFRLTDIESGVASTSIQSAAIHDNKLFFSANAPGGQVELYSSDGTVVGTSLFLDIGGTDSSSPYSLASYEGYLFFGAYRNPEGYELFYIQGSNPASLSVVNPSMSTDPYPVYIFGSRGSLYFQGVSNTSKYYELHKLVIDACPDDSSKTVPGVCGCGIADIDTDLDGTLNCNDGCISDPAKIASGICGCGVADADTDSDGTFNCNDACLSDPSKVVVGVCGCGVSDADANGNGQADCIDNGLLTTQPVTPGASYNKNKSLITFTLPAVNGARYVITVSQLQSKNGRVLGKKKFETATRIIKKKLSQLLIKGKKLRGWIGISYQLKIGTRLGIASRVKKIKI